MTHDEMQELKRLAEESPSADELYITVKGSTVWGLKAFMDFTRSANPVVALALIARIEGLEGK
jgi:hypothetical protein